LAEPLNRTGVLRGWGAGLAGEPLDGADDEVLQGPMFLPRITEMDGRGGIVAEVAGGLEGFKHQIICVLLRCVRGAKYL
jgi:hypothetical protein